MISSVSSISQTDCNVNSYNKNLVFLEQTKELLEYPLHFGDLVNSLTAEKKDDASIDYDYSAFLTIMQYYFGLICYDSIIKRQEGFP